MAALIISDIEFCFSYRKLLLLNFKTYQTLKTLRIEAKNQLHGILTKQKLLTIFFSTCGVFSSICGY